MDKIIYLIFLRNVISETGEIGSMAYVQEMPGDCNRDIKAII